LTGVFATKAVNAAGGNGLLAGNGHQLLVQLLAVGVTVALGAVGTVAIFAALKVVMPLRVTTADEITGADLTEHGEEAYYGDDVNALAGRAIPIGGSVMLPIVDVRPATR
jgi:Amt family ammonium transporter